MDQKRHTVKLHTAQTEAVCQTLFRESVCYSRAAYVARKYGESAPVFLTAYRWFVGELERFVPRPPEAEFPYWAFGDLYTLEQSGSGRVLTMEVPVEEAVFFDLYDWNRVMQLHFMGETEGEERSFRRELALRGLREMDVMLSAFYPEERRQIQESWQRLFRHHRAVLAGDLSGVGSLQAGLWRLKASWVTDMV